MGCSKSKTVKVTPAVNKDKENNVPSNEQLVTLQGKKHNVITHSHESHAGETSTKTKHESYAGETPTKTKHESYAGETSTKTKHESYAGETSTKTKHESYACETPTKTKHESYAGETSTTTKHESYAGETSTTTKHESRNDDVPTITKYESKSKGNGKIPALSPPRRKKTDIIPDISIFKRIEDHVKNAPNSVTDSVKTLADYLLSMCSNELEILRAIFCWVAYNIDYDIKSYFSGSLPSQDASSVLKSRKSVCQGYSDLCLSLCKAMNVPCILVSGIAKGYGYKLGEVMTKNTKTDHAWNLVLVQGEWRPWDCTWGAGYLSGDNKYKREFDEFWFLTDPADFLPRHFPYMNGSSMLISLPDENTCEIFVRPPKVSTYLLTIFGHAIGDEGEYNHSLVKYIIRCHKAKTAVEPFPEKKDAWGFKYPLAAECGIKQVRRAPFKFSAKDGQVNIPVPLCQPTQMTLGMEHACNKHQNLTDFTFIILNEEKAIISARLPRSGYYKLTVFASRPQEKNGILRSVGDLLIYADKAHINCLPFPLSYSFARDHCACLLQPLCRQVAAGAKTLFRVHAPRLQTIYIGNSAMELKNDGVWEAEVIPAKGSLTIFGSMAKNAHSFSGMYAFEVI